MLGFLFTKFSEMRAAALVNNKILVLTGKTLTKPLERPPSGTEPIIP
jgi:hypothetical protein